MTACPECLRSTPCEKCAAGIACIQPHICDEPECLDCALFECQSCADSQQFPSDGYCCGRIPPEPEPEPEGCPDCSEHSRCGACADDFQYHHDKDDE